MLHDDLGGHAHAGPAAESRIPPACSRRASSTASKAGRPSGDRRGARRRRVSVTRAPASRSPSAQVTDPAVAIDDPAAGARDAPARRGWSRRAARRSRRRDAGREVDGDDRSRVDAVAPDGGGIGRQDQGAADDRRAWASGVGRRRGRRRGRRDRATAWASDPAGGGGSGVGEGVGRLGRARDLATASEPDPVSDRASAWASDREQAWVSGRPAGLGASDAERASGSMAPTGGTTGVNARSGHEHHEHGPEERAGAVAGSFGRRVMAVALRPSSPGGRGLGSRGREKVPAGRRGGRPAEDRVRKG